MLGRGGEDYAPSLVSSSEAPILNFFCTRCLYISTYKTAINIYNIYRPQRSCGKVMFLHTPVCPGGSLYRGSLYRGSLSRGVSVWGGLCPGGFSVQGDLCLGGLCPIQWVSVQGVSVQEVSVQGGGVSFQGWGLCSGGSLSGRSPHTVIRGMHPTGIHSSISCNFTR